MFKPGFGLKKILQEHFEFQITLIVIFLLMVQGYSHVHAMAVQVYKSTFGFGSEVLIQVV